MKNVWNNIKRYASKTWGYTRLGWWKLVGLAHPGKDSPEFQAKLDTARSDAKA